MKKIFLGFMAMVAMFVTSCDTKKTVAVEELNGEWNVVSINGQEVTAEEVPFLGMDIAKKNLYGFTGCNRIMGTLDIAAEKPGSVAFENVAGTKMMCRDMKLEDSLMKALEKVAGYDATEKGFNLLDVEGNVVMTIAEREKPVASINDLNGKWLIKNVKDIDLKDLDEVPFIEFVVAEKKIHGNAGCNIMNGEFEQSEGNASSLKFVQMITTMKSCPEMDKETAILSAMNQICSFKIENAVVSLMDENNEVLISLARK